MQQRRRTRLSLRKLHIVAIELFFLVAVIVEGVKYIIFLVGRR